ncbi:MAG: CDP-glycerol glycerophosphotransferase family protein [Firmicutes bacterium]|nr:CDP-glycerol glycerophosphotransferase family protein [Bacillota bacterium]
METIKKHLRNFLKKHAHLRLFVRKVKWRVEEQEYNKTAKGTEIDEKLVLFETFMGRQYGCNPKAIYEYMISDPAFDDYRLVWSFFDPQAKKAQFSALQRAEVVEVKTRAYYEICARAKYIVTNSALNYRIQKRPGQVFLQTWHGTPLKRLRCDIEAEKGNVNNTLNEIKIKNDMDVVRYDLFLSPSPFATDKFISSFNMKELGIENIVRETGYPRNDLLFHFTEEDVEEQRRQLNIPAGKKVILYAPTFRDNEHDGAGYTYDVHLDFDRLQRELGDEYVILFRAHYFVANRFDFGKYPGFVIDASKLDDITPLYIISDVLVTDYSSVFFDYANLKRPMLFYMYDLDDYAEGIRGFYFSIDEIPGPKIRTEDELIRWIKDLEGEPYGKQYFDKYGDTFERFAEKFAPLEDGRASERAASELIRAGREETQK